MNNNLQESPTNKKHDNLDLDDNIDVRYRKNSNTNNDIDNNHYNKDNDNKPVDTDKAINDNTNEAKKMGSEEGKVDKESESQLTVQNFLSKNGEQKLLLEKRDDTLGFTRYISLLIFLYLLISPIFPMLKDAGGTAWVLALYVLPLSLLIWAFIEYWCRMECWFCCICRGIILDMEKTTAAPKWLNTLPMYFVYFFMLVAAVLWGIAYEPKPEEDGETPEWKRYVGAALFLLGILFMLSLTRDIVDVEGARRLCSVNEFIHFLGDPKILEARGYKVVHYSQLGIFLKHKDPNTPFSWNEIFKLSHEPNPEGASRWNLTWGTQMSFILRENKDLTE